MSSEPTANSSVELVNGASVVLVGAGVVTVALFPLALPIVILTLAAAIPVVVPLVALGLLAAGIALPILLVRSLGRPAMRAPRPSAPAVRGHRLHSSAR